MVRAVVWNPQSILGQFGELGRLNFEGPSLERIRIKGRERKY